MIVTHHGDQSMSYQHMSMSPHHHPHNYKPLHIPYHHHHHHHNLYSMYEIVLEMLRKKLGEMKSSQLIKYNMTSSSSVVSVKQSVSEEINREIIHIKPN